MAIKVNYATLKAKAESLGTKLEDLAKIISNAETAGNDAVTAAGGETTAVGAAIKTSLKTVTDGQLSQISTVVSNMKDAVNKVSTTYQTEAEDFLAAIKRLTANQDGGTGTGAPGGQAQ